MSRHRLMINICIVLSMAMMVPSVALAAYTWTYSPANGTSQSTNPLDFAATVTGNPGLTNGDVSVTPPTGFSGTWTASYKYELNDGTGTFMHADGIPTARVSFSPALKKNDSVTITWTASTTNSGGTTQEFPERDHYQQLTGFPIVADSGRPRT